MTYFQLETYTDANIDNCRFAMLTLEPDTISQPDNYGLVLSIFSFLSRDIKVLMVEWNQYLK